MSLVTSSRIILQVVHDCRKISDVLWHQYQVQIVNVFDMQVFIYKIREESLKEDQSMWMQQPSSDVILDAAVKNVAFILELRIALLERMLSRFVDGVDVYLSVIRDTSKQQYGE
ncbi:hypothetical protein LSAT2_004259, partial [Lamellibrachia satsuma]